MIATLTGHPGSTSDARGPGVGKALFKNASVALPCPGRTRSAEAPAGRACARLQGRGTDVDLILQWLVDNKRMGRVGAGARSGHCKRSR